MHRHTCATADNIRFTGGDRKHVLAKNSKRVAGVSKETKLRKTW
jgi:hypothetical protein